MADIAVGQADPHNPSAVLCALEVVLQVLQHRRAEAARQHVLLDRHQQLVIGGEPLSELGVERLGKAPVGDRRLQPLAAQDLGGAQRDLHAVAVAEQRHPLAGQQELALPDLDLPRLVGHRRPLGGAARIAEGNRPVVVGESRAQHVDQHRLVTGRHHHHVGQRTEVGDVNEPVVGGPVVADQPGAIHGEDHVQLLQADVVDELVEGALQEG